MLKLIHRDLIIYQRRNYIVLAGFGFWITFTMIQSGPGAMLPIAMLTMALFGFTMTAQVAFTYDDMTHMNRLLRAMPVRISTLVGSRYAACLIMALAGALITVACLPLMNLLMPSQEPLNLSLDLGITMIAIAALLLFGSVMMPVMFRFGQKARYPLMVVYIVIASGVPILFSSSGIPQDAAALLKKLPSTGVCALVLALATGLAVAMFMLSVRIVARKEE